MDAHALKACERFRPWLQLGLRHILLPEDSPLAGSYAQIPARIVQERAQPGPSTLPAPPGPGPAPQPAGPVFSRPSRPGPAPAAAAALAQTTPALADSRPGDEAPGWSVIWRRYRPKLIVPSRTVWTYWELGADMADAPDAARKELFGNIMTALSKRGWPKGSIAFWPVSFLRRGELVARRELFLRGVREAGAHTALCFGARAQAVLFEDRPYVHETATLGELTVLVLPGPEDMLGPGAEAAKRLAWERLKDYRSA